LSKVFIVEMFFCVMNKKMIVGVVLAFVVLGGAFWFYFNSDSLIGVELEDDVFSAVEGVDYVDVDVGEARGLIDSTNIMVIDVSADYSEGRLLNAVWYNYFDETLNWAVPLLENTGSYLVYSRDDESSLVAVEMLVEAGFVSVYRLDGGFLAWESSGEEVEL